uniref:Uncharacterized protein n=1 Tax=Panagrolaimus davidi TaxID=227884 RepID=A0A914QBI1_9BILA
MASSIGLKVVFIVVIIIALIITLASIFTPAWKVTNGNQGSDQKIGLVTTDCGGNNQPGQIYQQQQGCQQAKDNRQSYEKWTLALLIISAIFQLIAIISALVTIKSEKTKVFLNSPVNVIIALILIIIAIIVYGSKYNKDSQNSNNNQFYQPGQPQPPPQNYQSYGMNGNYKLGYSFWLSIVAGIFLVIAAILGLIAACMNGSTRNGGYPHDRTVIQHTRVQTSMAQ